MGILARWILIFSCFLAGCSGVPPQTFETFYPDRLSQRLELGWWVSSPLTVEEIELKSVEELKDSNGVPQVPFGFANTEWEAMKALMQPGDVLVELGFSRRLRDGSLDLQTGYALARNDVIIAEIVTLVT